MFKLSCPSCGADVVFKSKASVFAVCTYCKSTLLRQDMNVELYGKMSEIQEDMTPFQIGTTGYYLGQKFELLGRLRIAWSDGFWNEWYGLFANQQELWLAEAQGFYGVSFFSEDYNLPLLEELKVGGQISLHGKFFQVDDIKEATCVGSAGELPFAAPIGRKAVSIDLSASGGKFANIEYSGEEKRLYIGEYLEFDDFKFSNLRELEGW